MPKLAAVDITSRIRSHYSPEMKESLDRVVCVSDGLESEHVSGRGVVPVVILAILSASNIILRQKFTVV